MYFTNIFFYKFANLFLILFYMKRFKLINNISGWIVFIAAAIVYLLTIEYTASLWDCGEFIATSFKLEVGHPPGAPLFMICTRVFGLLVGENKELFAIMVNSFSALMSGFCILFLFWSITHLARKLVIKTEQDFTLTNLILIIGSGVVGAIAYTFTDSFWFSAVEGEVYASSSFFTAIVFWAILKWEDVADEKYANRWIILIAYLMGLSIGVHLLNLLAIPAIVFVYYFKKYKVTKRGILLALTISVIVLALMLYGVIQGLIEVASWFELAFVNGFGLPFNSGILFYALLVLGGLSWGIYYTYKNQKAIMNTILLALMVAIIGYSSFAMVVIRSLALPPINEDRPNNVFALLSYLNREQYGDRPLFYGQYYNAPPIDVKEGHSNYAPINGRYEVIEKSQHYVYDPQFCTFFPRMFSSDPSHIKAYKEWAKIKGREVKFKDSRTGEDKTENVPTFSENMRFFFNYQLGWMYFRYFMWNFVGRQNDTQGYGEINDGNWISGVNFIDSSMLGDQSKLPDHLKKVPSRNVYYFLPLLLGLLGLFFQLNRNVRDFWVVMLLFFLTGIAIVLYLNQTPYQPRERDYAYAGSFYAYAIWIGLGVLQIFSWLKFLKNKSSVQASIAVVLCFVAVPVLMGKENWRDHDRSGRYAPRAYAVDYLNACAPNAILFTYGDNDTFPLWYAQEVEGVRTDVRVVNTMLLNTDWYISQMQQKMYESEPLPISLTYDKYMGDHRNVVYLFEKSKEFTNLKQAYEFEVSDDPRTKKIPEYGDQNIDYIPVKSFYIDVDTAAVKATGTVKEQDMQKVVKRLEWRVGKNYLSKSDFIIFDMLTHNNWKRPIYFASASNEATLGMSDYLQLEGIVYRLVPIKTPCSNGDCGRINSDIMYKNLMEKFDWGRINEPDVYIDHFHERTLSILRLRYHFARLASALLSEGKKDSAIKVLDRCIKMIPSYKVPHDLSSLNLFEVYFAAGEKEKGLKLVNELFNQSQSELRYYFSLKPKFIRMYDYEIRKNLQTEQELLMISRNYKQESIASLIDKDFSIYYQKFMVMIGKQ